MQQFNWGFADEKKISVGTFGSIVVVFYYRGIGARKLDSQLYKMLHNDTMAFEIRV